MALHRYSFELAKSPEDIQGYFSLRQAIFCAEQRLFDQDDADTLDGGSYPIVALDHEAEPESRVVGVVRIYEQSPRLWYGGRLGVHPNYRRVGRIGKGLIQKAVTTANTWGCDRFLATVQEQNVRFFQRQHWDSLEEMVLCDRLHHLMEADLAYYPPGTEARPSLPWATQQVS
jgi:putative N-acetyltransferase (TIGR04045 family)